MKVKQLVIFFIITCYGCIASAGHLVVLKELLNSGNHNHQLTSEKKSHPISATPVWTVKKHFPPASNTDTFVYSTSTNVIITYKDAIALFLPCDSDVVLSSLDSSPSKPRDPPVI